MAVVTHHDVSKNPFLDKSIIELDTEALHEGPAEGRWSIRQCVLLWVVLSAAGWVLAAGLAKYLG